MEEQFYTVAEAAKFLKVSRDTITRLFADEPGVVDLGSPERLHYTNAGFIFSTFGRHPSSSEASFLSCATLVSFPFSASIVSHVPP